MTDRQTDGQATANSEREVNVKSTEKYCHAWLNFYCKSVYSAFLIYCLKQCQNGAFIP